jgi:hypothetical protein
MARRYPHRQKTPFGAQVLAAASIFGVMIFTAAPQLQKSTTGSTAMLDQIKTVEQSAYYPNCNAARAAGSAPMRSGTPGYRDELDGDSDGIACEPYR